MVLVKLDLSMLPASVRVLRHSVARTCLAIHTGPARAEAKQFAAATELPLFAAAHTLFHRAIARRRDESDQHLTIIEIPKAHFAIVTAARQAF